MSLLVQPDTTRIHRLTIRGPSGTRQQLLSRLETAHWPVPPDGSWVLVRRVIATASRNSLADELLQKTRLQINTRDPKEVVCFPSLAALLAALITDIYKGVAPRYWYWQRWSRLWPLPAGDAIEHLLQEHPRQIPAVCHHLSADSHLTTVWQQLSRDNASALLGSLRMDLGLPPASADTDRSSQDTPVPTMPIPERQVQVWRPIVASLPETDPRSELALLILASDSAALALNKAPSRTLAAIRQQLVSPQAGRETADGSLPTPASGTQDPAPPRERRPQQESGPSPSPQVTYVSEAVPGADPAMTRDHYGKRTSADIPGPAKEQPALYQNTPGPPSSRQHPESLHSLRHTGSIRTDMAGTLYLLNVLNRPAIQDIMAETWQELPNGWAWLYRLARELDLDPEDNLCEFLAERLGLESATGLETLPGLPQRQRIVALAAQWFHRDDLWSPALIRGPGELAYTPGHLDLYQDSSQVRLEVRLAGLDLNPGWLPWLGTVVTFHFDHFPHLKRAAS